MFRYIAVAAAIATSSFAYAGQGYPSLDMRYSSLLDGQLADKTGFAPKPEWVAELEKRVPELEKVWNDEAPIVMPKVIELTGGKTYKEKEMHAALILGKMASLSFPLVLNVRRYMNTVTGNDPDSMFLFTAQVFHELLHTFVVENLPDTTPLLEKYKNEDQVCQNHLHLMAIQATVYTNLGRTEDLKALIASDSEIGGPYKRAWDIVIAEGYQAFVAEFK